MRIEGRIGDPKQNCHNNLCLSIEEIQRNGKHFSFHHEKDSEQYRGYFLASYHPAAQHVHGRSRKERETHLYQGVIFS